jgi:flagellar biosynthesis protein FlhG
MENVRNKLVKTIAVTSGKGGVGKTNLVANLAIPLRNMGKEVMILDADLGLSNIDVLLQLAPKYNLQHVLSGEMKLKDIVVEGPYGIKILPASSGVQELTSLDEFQRLRILEAFEEYEEDVDILLVDTGAGISENVAFFCVTAQEIVVVVSPEPTSITDAYALIKVLFTRYREKDFHVIVNLVRNAEEGKEVFRRISLATERFLNLSLKCLGYIPFDDSVRKAVRAQRPFVDVYPDCPASKGIYEIAPRLLNQDGKIKGTLQLFIRDLLSSTGPNMRTHS